MRGLTRWGAAGLLAAALTLSVAGCSGDSSNDEVDIPSGDDPGTPPPQPRPELPDSGGGPGDAGTPAGGDGGVLDGGGGGSDDGGRDGGGGGADGGGGDGGTGGGGGSDGGVLDGGTDGGGTDGGVVDGGTGDGGAIDGGMADAGTGGGGGAASTNFERILGGAPGVDTGESVAIASDGDLLVASTHRVTLPDFGEGRQPNKGNAALSRFNPRGIHLWTYAEVHEGNCRFGDDCTYTALKATAAAVDMAGRSALATLYYEEGDFDPFLYRQTPRITVLDRNGKVLWKRVIQSPGGDSSVDDLGFDASGNLYAGGFIQGPGWDFGDGQPRGTEFLPASFIASYAPDGTLRWVKLFGDARGSSRYGVMEVEPDGSIVFTGEMTGRLSFGGEELVGNEDGKLPDRQTYVAPRLFVARFGPEGGHRWSRLLAPTAAKVDDLAVGPAGIALSGYFDHSFTFGGRTLTASHTEGGAQDGFVAVMAPDGQERWAISMRSDIDDRVFGVGWAPNGDVWAMGAIWGNGAVSDTRLPDTEEDGPRLVLARLRGATGEAVSATVPQKGIPDSGDLDVDARGVVVVTGGVLGGTDCERCFGPVELYLMQQMP